MVSNTENNNPFGNDDLHQGTKDLLRLANQMEANHDSVQEKALQAIKQAEEAEQLEAKIEKEKELRAIEQEKEERREKIKRYVSRSVAGAIFLGAASVAAWAGLSLAKYVSSNGTDNLSADYAISAKEDPSSEKEYSLSDERLRSALRYYRYSDGTSPLEELIEDVESRIFPSRTTGNVETLSHRLNIVDRIYQAVEEDQHEIVSDYFNDFISNKVLSYYNQSKNDESYVLLESLFYQGDEVNPHELVSLVSEENLNNLLELAEIGARVRIPDDFDWARRVRNDWNSYELERERLNWESIRDYAISERERRQAIYEKISNYIIVNKN